MTEEIFNKILDGSATDEEKLNFYELIENDEALSEKFYQYKNLYTISSFQADRHSDLQNENFKRFWNQVKPLKAFRIGAYWSRYAAVFLLMISFGFLIKYIVRTQKDIPPFSRQISYTSEKGSVSTIHLEDGSSIWLSSGSMISIETRSTGEMIAQLNGEAYFDMIPNPSRKLTVDLGLLKVRDIGTSFNIRAYKSELRVYTMLVKGEIDFFNRENKSILTMKPGEYMQFDKQTKNIAISQQDATIATAWKDGKFVFIDKPLKDICTELENWYNVQIIIQNKSLANTKYTSVIKRTTTVNMVMKMLSLTDKINYKIDCRKEGRDIVYVY